MTLKPRGKIAELLEHIKDKENISIMGLQRDARLAVFAMSEKSVWIDSDYVKAKEAYQFLQGLTDVVFLPARSDSVGYSFERFGQNDYERAESIAEIAEGVTHVVTYMEAAMQLYPAREEIMRRTIKLKTGDDCDKTELVQRLISSGYKRVQQLDGKAQFAVRGDIIDVAPIGSDDYYRLMLDFDIIESIKIIDAETQITVKKVDSIFIAPFGEAYFTPKEAEEVKKQIEVERRKLSQDANAHFSGIYSEIEMRLSGGRSDLPFVMPYLKGACSFAEFMSGYAGFISDAKVCYDSGVLLLKEHVNRIAILTQSGDALASSIKQLQMFEGEKCIKPLAVYHTGLSQNRFSSSQRLIELTDSVLPDYNLSYETLASDIKNWVGKDYEVKLFAANAAIAQKLKEFLSGEGIAVNSTDIDCKVEIYEKPLNGGCVLHECKCVIIGSKKLVKGIGGGESRKRKEVMPLPSVGEYVVHTTHGIGKCEAIERLKVGDAEHDYVIISYAAGDKLYLPVENLDSLSKYSYSGEGEPKLNRLGGGQFARVKERIKSSLKEMAINLVALYSKRAAGKGHKYVSEPVLMDEFIAAFNHVDTDDQEKATKDILNDLALGKIMDRLVCGDVGFGKTEVALRAAYRVVLEGQQVAFLCPTTLLALQHYKTAKKRMEQFGVKVAMLSRLSTAKEIESIVQGLKDGSVDMVCGTHKLLSKKLEFKDLGLLILDEEQRFGVQHKEQLKEKRESVNVLTLSATPIPRTLHMSLTGMRDISMLTTPPFERLPVQTFVAEYSDGLVVDAIMREYARGGQSYIVYNRVQGIEQYAVKVRSLLPELSVGVVHGQMAAEQSEKVIGEFAEGKLDILIATTIIENGIDIPRANTMIVVDSDKFGLSQMHQLRGRIGRSDRLATAYFTYDSTKQITSVAMERLNAIMQCNELGSGFMLAMRDLELRGAGNILGREQHGHMEQVGYDTYMKLLEEVMAELNGEEVLPDREVVVRTNLSASLPEDYVTDDRWRMKQYGNISHISTLSELRKTESTMRDIYGAPPQCVINLLSIAYVKNRVLAIGGDEVDMNTGESAIHFKLLKSASENIIKCAKDCGATINVSDKVSLKFSSGKKLFRFLANENM